VFVPRQEEERGVKKWGKKKAEEGWGHREKMERKKGLGNGGVGFL
jgi:hypothetical protein